MENNSENKIKWHERFDFLITIAIVFISLFVILILMQDAHEKSRSIDRYIVQMQFQEVNKKISNFKAEISSLRRTAYRFDSVPIYKEKQKDFQSISDFYLTLFTRDRKMQWIRLATRNMDSSNFYTRSINNFKQRNND